MQSCMQSCWSSLELFIYNLDSSFHSSLAWLEVL